MSQSSARIDARRGWHDLHANVPRNHTCTDLQARMRTVRRSPHQNDTQKATTHFAA
jgi:hypothetical protein